MQIVQTPDGHITGQFTETLLIDGRIEDSNASVIGVVSGKNLSLQLRPIAFLPIATDFSGIADRSGLSINGATKGGSVSTMRLTRSTLAEFQEAASKTRGAAQSIQIVNAQAEAKSAAAESLKTQTKKIADLVSRILGFIKKENASWTTFPKYEDNFTDTTKKMQTRLERERSLRNHPEARAARGQIVTYLNQDGLDAEQVHLRDLNGEANFAEAEQIFSKAIEEADNTCSSSETTVSDPLKIAFHNACDSLKDIKPEYSSTVKETKNYISQLESVYITETQKQKQIITESIAIE